MLLSIANLKFHVAAAERGRYALNAIALTEKGTVSSNGREMLFVPYPDVRLEGMPSIEGVDASSFPKSYPALISPEDAMRAAGMVPKRHINPAYHYIHVAFDGDKITLAATDGERVQKIVVASVEGQYPNFVSVLPDFSKSKSITFELSYLLNALKTLRGASGEQYVTMRFIDKEKAVNFSTRDGVALLEMPSDDGLIKDGFSVFKEKAKEAQPKRRRKAQKPEQPNLVPDATAEATPEAA